MTTSSSESNNLKAETDITRYSQYKDLTDTLLHSMLNKNYNKIEEINNRINGALQTVNKKRNELLDTISNTKITTIENYKNLVSQWEEYRNLSRQSHFISQLSEKTQVTAQPAQNPEKFIKDEIQKLGATEQSDIVFNRGNHLTLKQDITNKWDAQNTTIVQNLEVILQTPPSKNKEALEYQNPKLDELIKSLNTKSVNNNIVHKETVILNAEQKEVNKALGINNNQGPQRY